MKQRMLAPVLTVICTGLALTVAVLATRLLQQPPLTDTRSTAREIQRLKRENRELRDQVEEFEEYLASLDVEFDLPDPASSPADDNVDEQLAELVADGESAAPNDKVDNQKKSMQEKSFTAPTTAEGWIELAVSALDGKSPDAKRIFRQLEGWLKNNPAHVTDLVALMKDATGLEAKILTKLFVKHSVGNEEAQKALQNLVQDPSLTDDATVTALNTLRETLRHDPLALDRLTDLTRESIANLARYSDGAVQQSALGVFDRMPEDPLAQQIFLQTWTSGNLSDGAQRYALRGLRFADPNQAAQIMMDALSNNTDPAVRRIAAGTLGWVAQGENVTRAYSTLENSIYREADTWTQFSMALSMGRMNRGNTVQVLRQIESSNPDPFIAERWGRMADALESDVGWGRINRLSRQTLKEIRARDKQDQSR